MSITTLDRLAHGDPSVGRKKRGILEERRDGEPSRKSYKRTPVRAADGAKTDGSMADFLGDLQLCELLSMFSRELITMSDLPLLSDADLKELGVPMGPRRRIQAALAPAKPAVRGTKPGAPRALPGFEDESARPAARMDRDTGTDRNSKPAGRVTS